MTVKHSASAEVLEETLETIRTKFGSQNGDMIIKEGYYELLTRSETLEPVKLAGLGKSVKDEKTRSALDPILDELVVEYGDIFSVGPVKRLVGATAMILMGVAKHNMSGGAKEVPKGGPPEPMQT